MRRSKAHSSAVPSAAQRKELAASLLARFDQDVAQFNKKRQQFADELDKDLVRLRALYGDEVVDGFVFETKAQVGQGKKASRSKQSRKSRLAADVVEEVIHALGKGGKEFTANDAHKRLSATRPGLTVPRVSLYLINNLTKLGLKKRTQVNQGETPPKKNFYALV